VISVLVALAFTASGPALLLLRQPSEVVPLARQYVEISAAGLLPFFVFVVLRQSMQAMLSVRPVLVAVVVANVVNVAANWVLIFGNLGAPALGVAGSAWSTVLARWVMLVTLLGVGWGPLRPHLTGSWRMAFEWGPLWRTVQLGAPIGFQWFFEAGAFAVATLMFGWLGTVPLAAHEVALSLASLTFMVPVFWASRWRRRRWLGRRSAEPTCPRHGGMRRVRGCWAWASWQPAACSCSRSPARSLGGSRQTQR